VWYCEETIAISNPWQAFIHICVSMRSSATLFANLAKKQPAIWPQRAPHAANGSLKAYTRRAIRAPESNWLGEIQRGDRDQSDKPLPYAQKKNTDNSRTLCTKMQQGLPTWNRKPFAFNQEMVAGVRFELTTFGL
jgi:hypothetical protein